MRRLKGNRLPFLSKTRKARNRREITRGIAEHPAGLLAWTVRSGEDTPLAFSCVGPVRHMATERTFSLWKSQNSL